jgi:hypothetical protein
MALSEDNETIVTPFSQHTARRSGDGWVVTWLSGRTLTLDQAKAAMSIADAVGEIPAGEGPGTYSAQLWELLNAWAAELDLTGTEAVSLLSEPPGETAP